MARFTGTAGNDTRTGATNQENLFFDFGQGLDVLTGGNRADTFNLSVDLLRDRVDGGQGIDTVNYSGADRGVTVDLHNGLTTAKFYNGEAVPVEGGNGFVTRYEDKIVTELRNIENVVGSRYDDTIVGNAGDNVIEGGGGADTIHGGAGRDTVSYEHSAQGVTVVLGSEKLGLVGLGAGGDAAGDRLVSVENVIGSQYNDVFVGHSEDNVFTGGNGTDTFIFRDGIGHDTITDFDARGGDHDILRFESYFRDFQDLRQHMEARGNDVVITIDEHNSITLENVRLSHLDADDFSFL